MILKRKALNSIFLTLVSGLLFINVVDAQKGGRKKATGGGGTKPGKQTGTKSGNNNSGYNTQSSGYGTSNGNSGYLGNNGNNGQSTSSQGSKSVSGIPYKVMPSSNSGGLNDTFKMSLRNDNIIQKNLVKDIEPLPYSHIREDDAVFKQRIWRIIDAREKINLPFSYSAVEENGSQRFISILYNAIKSGEVTAFAPEPLGDDRFTTPMTKEQVQAAFGAKMDTFDHYDENGNVDYKNIAAREVSPDSIYKFRIKEEVVFDKEESRMITRILGICPMMPVTLSDGTVMMQNGQPQYKNLFWVYYPDIRTLLSKYEAYNPKNYGKRITWDAIFQERMFSSYIVKSTLNNPKNQSLKEIIRDPLFELYEGEKIKDKIFNYEQDLWAY